MPPAHPTLHPQEVHVWQATLERSAADIAQLRQCLSSDEVARAERFFFVQHRQHFIAARGTLRHILSHYTHVPPQDIQFTYSKHGKPALAIPADRDIQFNLSHSHGLAVYGIALRRRIGIDLERVRDDVAHEDIARRFFSEREYAILQALPAHERHVMFFTCWTRKESYIKAQGTGLWHPLDQFDVNPVPGAPASITVHASAGDADQQWTLCDLFPGALYAAAITAAGTDWRLRCWQWSIAQRQA